MDFLSDILDSFTCLFLQHTYILATKLILYTVQLEPETKIIFFSRNNLTCYKTLHFVKTKLLNLWNSGHHEFLEVNFFCQGFLAGQMIPRILELHTLLLLDRCSLKLQSFTLYIYIFRLVKALYSETMILYIIPVISVIVLHWRFLLILSPKIRDNALKLTTYTTLKKITIAKTIFYMENCLPFLLY